MTFACKEEFIFFEHLSRRQKQIFPDACDHGIVLTEHNKAEIRRNLNEMLAVFKGPRFEYKKETWEHGSTISFNIPIEIDSGMEVGYRFSFSYNRDPRRRIEFVTILIRRISTPIRR